MVELGRLHVITDCTLQEKYGHAELARLAAAGGADTIQFRQKSGDMRTRFLAAKDTAAACRDAGIPLIVDDDVATALAIGADGVHLGQRDLPVNAAREVVGDAHLIGGTATNVEQARQAAGEGADYIGFGPVFPTQSKEDPASVKGLAGLQEVCAAVSLPVIAIGGMTADRVSDVLEAGAHGLATLSAVVLARSPERAAQKFRKAIDQHLAD